ncbi:MAG: RdgB/HAM1 family non-canonical purine NTP pyrophosphatase [Tissierellia bacterium]|jgi:XTP/dITP diphosphohydrolase|nr:RdgB/HAM1 family non-canonical purine NTP pyrophosphatase [Tissierellia bacterium]
MKTIVVASHNSGKIEEIRYILRHWKVKLIGLHELGFHDEIPEDGKSFRENALIKAREIKKLTDFPVLSDDSGMLVEAMGARPGIYTARYGGDISFGEKRKKMLEEMKGIENRNAFFACEIAFLYGDREFTQLGLCFGEVAQEERGDFGFGFDSIFYYPPLDKTFGELPMEEKHNLSHRWDALHRLEEKLKNEGISYLR